MRRLRFLHTVPAAAIYIAIGVLAGCGDSAQTGPRATLELRHALTATAAQDLDGSGHFAFQPPPASGDIPEITLPEAIKFAAAWLQQLGPMVLADLQREHGDTIVLSEVSSCRRALYARSAWRGDPTLANNPFAASYIRAYGPYWLVPFCSASGDQVTTVAVSAYATDLSLSGGKLVIPVIGGEWFHWQGIPQGQESELPTGPEDAAIRAAQLTGKLVTAVPELVIPDRSEGGPMDARWRITLDQAATVLVGTAQQPRQVADLYIGWRPLKKTSTADVAAPIQPSTLRFTYPTNLVLGQPAPAQVVYAEGIETRDPGIPIAFDPVTPPAGTE